MLNVWPGAMTRVAGTWVPYVIDCAPGGIVELCVSPGVIVEAAQSGSPACEARIVQVRTSSSVAWAVGSVPVVPQIAGVSEVNVTVMPEVAVALKGTLP